jgi:hypothetical protein
MRRSRLLWALLLAVPRLEAQRAAVPGTGPRFLVRCPAARSAAPLDGRLLLMLSTDSTAEPRMQISDISETQLIFGRDVDAWAGGHVAVVDGRAEGFPLARLSEVPAGRYRVQALLNRYETFRRADGHVVTLPPDRGEGQQWNRKPGNLYSAPRWITFDPRRSAAFTIDLDQEIPAIPDPAETKYVRHIRIQSKLLSDFWGRPMFLGAHVLLPFGFDEHPEARYPLVIDHGHFPETFEGWRETPPDPDLKPDSSERFRLAGYNRIQQQAAWQLHQDWTGPGFPRVLLVQIQHPTPYYDDSYAVNSVNNGPYQDALLTELVPLLEKQFRLIPESNARFLTGGSTGGWECAALQIQRPDFFGGAWCLYPDPVDFHRNQLVDIYSDTNAFVPNEGTAPWPERYMSRTPEGQPLLSQRYMSQLEAVLGSKARSGQQFDAWDAAYGPIGADGYPKRLWDRLTGTIDKSAAAWWRDKGYDLTENLVRNWSTNGPQLTGKMHVYVGDMDNYYLNLAVYRMEEAAAKLEAPKANFTFEYGRPMKPHGWQPMTNAEMVRMMDQFRSAHAVRP